MEGGEGECDVHFFLGVFARVRRHDGPAVHCSCKVFVYKLTHHLVHWGLYPNVFTIFNWGVVAPPDFFLFYPTRNIDLVVCCPMIDVGNPAPTLWLCLVLGG